MRVSEINKERLKSTEIERLSQDMVRLPAEVMHCKSAGSFMCQTDCISPPLFA